MKKGIFPIIKDEVHQTSGATTWGDDTTKDVGIIEITGNHAVDFDSTNYPGEPGDCVIVANAGNNTPSVTIAPDPFGDASMTDVALGQGESVIVLYHPSEKWIWFAGPNPAS